MKPITEKDFPVEGVMYALSFKTTPNFCELYLFLQGDPDWKKNAKNFSFHFDLLAPFGKLMRERVSPEQLRVIEALEVVHEHKLKSKFILDPELHTAHCESVYKWLVREVKRCFKTITLSSVPLTHAG